MSLKRAAMKMIQDVSSEVACMQLVAVCRQSRGSSGAERLARGALCVAAERPETMVASAGEVGRAQAQALARSLRDGSGPYDVDWALCAYNDPIDGVKLSSCKHTFSNTAASPGRVWIRQPMSLGRIRVELRCPDHCEFVVRDAARTPPPPAQRSADTPRCATRLVSTACMAESGRGGGFVGDTREGGARARVAIEQVHLRGGVVERVAADMPNG